jgi:hypothetical protein
MHRDHAAVFAWQLTSSFHPAWRAAAASVALAVLVALVDVPILLGWLVLGHTWSAGEVGILLTALVAAAFGLRALRPSANGPRRTAHSS